MGEQRQIRSRSWNRMPTKRCSANGIMDEFIVVDDDDVIILDFPESSKGKASTTASKSVLQRVIRIDDDDDDDDDDDCKFVQEKSAAFRFSKCKQTFSTMPSSGVRFGLGSDSDSDFSDTDCSDCEILEGSHREVREQWEKAFLKKMKKAGSSQEAGPSSPHGHTNSRPGSECRTKQHDQTSYFFSPRNPDGGTETSSTFFGTNDRNPKTSLFGYSEVEEDNPAKHSANSRVFSKEDSPGPSSLSPKTQVEHERSEAPSTHFNSPKEPIYQSSFKEGEKQPNGAKVQPETSQSTKDNKKKKVATAKKNQKKKVAYQSSNKQAEASKSSLSQTSDGDGDTIPVLGIQIIGVRCEQGISSSSHSREPIIDPIPSTSGQVQGLHGTAPAIDIMLNREMLKETDEYKKAQEEEWESRQQQLQIQAEEAQRQRKRRKLEITRQLEMERRQKERVEEVRETQKKDEESMNMKEKIRGEITKSLKLLELKCINMASLLRGLGIPVGGGTSPLPQEVHAAYKRAVLKFHPDRASRGDIKQQVEAEEKFKLIARMKDKFLS